MFNFSFFAILFYLCTIWRTECAPNFFEVLTRFCQKRFFNKNLVEQCKGHSVDTMTHIFHYKSLKNKRENNVHDKIESFMAGANGKIHIGYIGDREKCVAIKLIRTDYDKKKIFENSIVVMNKIQKELPPKARQHIIELIDYGTAIASPRTQIYEHDQYSCASTSNASLSEEESDENESEYGALITELGTETFGQKIYTERTDFEADQSLTNVIRELIWPLNELHRVAMHLDYKPENLVYVELEESKVLKVIDFDGTYLLPVSKHKNGRLANFETDNLKILTGTDRYNPPEFYLELYTKKLSTKTDIWAVGIIIYEILFLQKKYKIYEEVNSDGQQFRKLLHCVNEIHRGFTLTKDYIKYIAHPVKFSAEWFTKFNVKMLFWIFRTWKDFPRISILLMNLLNVLPEMRMSAIGILDFVDGKCCPKELYDEDSKTLEIFSGLSVEKLAENIVERVQKIDDLEEKRKLLEMKRMLRKAIVLRKEMVDRLKVIRTHCDTVTTAPAEQRMAKV